MEEFNKALQSFLLDLNGDGIPDAVSETAATRPSQTVAGGLYTEEPTPYEAPPYGESLRPYFGGHNPVEEVRRAPINALLNLAEGVGGASGASVAAPVNALARATQEARPVAAAVDRMLPSPAIGLGDDVAGALPNVALPSNPLRSNLYEYRPFRDAMTAYENAQRNPYVRAVPGLQGLPTKEQELIIRQAQMEMLRDKGFGLPASLAKQLRKERIDPQAIRPNALSAGEAERGGRQPAAIRYRRGEGALENRRQK